MKKILPLFLTPILFGSTVLSQTIHVPTRHTNTWITADGIMKMPFQFDEAKDYKQLKNDPGLQPYFNYQLAISHRYGHERDNCSSPDLAFLPGKTEAAFRQSQVQWIRTLDTPTARNKPLERYQFVQDTPRAATSSSGLAQRAEREVDPSGRFSAETFLYRTVHKGSSANITHEWFHIYTFMYDSKLNQGVMLFCKTNEMTKRK